MVVPVIPPSSVVVAGGTPPSVVSIFLLVPGPLFASGGTAVLVVEDVFPALVAVDGSPGSFVVSIVVVGGVLVVYRGVMKVKFFPRIPGGKLNWMGSRRHPSIGDRAEGPLDSHGGQAHIKCVPLSYTLAAKQ